MIILCCFQLTAKDVVLGISSEWWMVILTAMLVLVGIGYVVYTIRLQLDNKNLLALERSKYELEMRPWIGIGETKHTASNKIHLTYKNFGKTPGYITRTSRTFYIGSKVVGSPGVDDNKQSIIFPGGELSSTGTRDTAVLIAQAKAENLSLEFHSEIEYCDVEGKCYVYREAYRYNPEENEFDLVFTFTESNDSDEAVSNNGTNKSKQ